MRRRERESAEKTLAAILLAYKETGMRPLAGDMIWDQNTGLSLCPTTVKEARNDKKHAEGHIIAGCATGALVWAGFRRPKHYRCIEQGFDQEADSIDPTETKCEGHGKQTDCIWYSVGAAAAHAMGLSRRGFEPLNL